MAEPIDIPEIDPELFTWDKYESNYGGRMNLDYSQSVDMSVMGREIRKRVVGRCDATRLYVRPREDMYAIMLEDDDHEKFWFHFPKTCLDMIMDGVYPKRT